MLGKFITFEGGEGTGKSTQVRALAERLAGHGLDHLVTREPGGTPAAEAIRDLLLSGRAARFGAEGEAYLFAAARADHVDAVIAPALGAGRWVICDRFIDSTRVYQADAGETLLRRLEAAAIGEHVPDLTIILDLPAELGVERAAHRGRSAPPDRFERDALGIHARRRAAFLAIAEAEPERCAVVDADASAEEVAGRVYGVVEARLLTAGGTP